MTSGRRDARAPGTTSDAGALRGAIARGERLDRSTFVLHARRRGPCRPEELAAQEALLPSSGAMPFGAEAARLAAAPGAALWMRDPADFEDVPGRRLYGPA